MKVLQQCGGEKSLLLLPLSRAGSVPGTTIGPLAAAANGRKSRNISQDVNSI